jgi:FMN reductase
MSGLTAARYTAHMNPERRVPVEEMLTTEEPLDEALEEVLEETLAHARFDGVIRAVGISGSPRAPSKSKTLLEHFLQQLEKFGAETKLIDVATLSAQALAAREQSPEIDDAMAAIGQADIVVASSPTYRALYTGVLKCFFDLMPQSHLASKLCVGLQTGIAPQHALAAEYGFRPLFASLEGTPLAVLYATDEQFEDGRPNEALSQQLHDIADHVVAVAGPQ